MYAYRRLFYPVLPPQAQATQGERDVDESVEESPDFIEVQPETSQGAAVSARAQGASGSRIGGVPARQQDMIFQRSMSKNVATALASYLTTAGFVEWDMEVLGLDIHI
jgi:hypothetical protein